MGRTLVPGTLPSRSLRNEGGLAPHALPTPLCRSQGLALSQETGASLPAQGFLTQPVAWPRGCQDLGGRPPLGSRGKSSHFPPTGLSWDGAGHETSCLHLESSLPGAARPRQGRPLGCHPALLALSHPMPHGPPCPGIQVAIQGSAPGRVSCGRWGWGRVGVAAAASVRSLRPSARTRPVPLGRGGSGPAGRPPGKRPWSPLGARGRPGAGTRGALGPGGAQGQPRAARLPPTSSRSPRRAPLSAPGSAAVRRAPPRDRPAGRAGAGMPGGPRPQPPA